MRVEQKEFGMMSENQKKCQETNLKYYLHGYDNLPDLIRHPYSTRNKNEIKLEQPVLTGYSKQTKLRKISAGDSLHNHVFAAATKEDAFDAPVMFVVWLDEYTKLEDPYPMETYNATKETVKIGGLKHGRMWLTGYVPEKDGKNTKEAKEVWDSSGIDTLNKHTGETFSGLYRYFITADDSYEQDDHPFDRYGETPRENIIYLEARRRQLEGKYAELQAWIREYPRHEYELWSSAGNANGHFDSVRIIKRLNELKENLSGQPQFEYGYLEWLDKSKKMGRGYGNGEFGPVEWVPLSREDIAKGVVAPFKWYNKELYPENMYNRVILNNIRDRRTGMISPGDKFINLIGADPTDYAEDSRIEEGSQDAYIVGTLPDPQLDAYVI